MGLFRGEQIGGSLMRLTVYAYIGDGVEPESGRRVDRAELG